MSNPYGITAENLMEHLPRALQDDSSMAAIAQGVADLLAARPSEIREASIYTRIDQLPEDLLDLLAYDFKIDWYDFDYPIESKRELLKTNYFVHRHLGTKAAVEAAISGIYQNTKVEEWWEYGADPYHFRLLIDATYEDVDPVKHQQILDRVAYYKNVRSHMDDVEYYARPEGEAVAYGFVALAGIGMCITASVEVPDWTPTDTVLTGTLNTLNLNRRRLI